MDEVKKWDLQQLPGFEAIEEPEETKKELKEYKKDYENYEDYNLYENENTKFKILGKDLNFITGTEDFDKGWFEFTRKDLEGLLDKHGFNNQNKYFLNITDSDERTLRLEEREKEPKKVITFEKSEIDKYLLNDKSANLLYFYSLKLPSYYQDKSLKVLEEALKKSTQILSGYKDAKKNVAKYDRQSFPGRAIAYPKKGEKARDYTKKQIEDHNIMEFYNYYLNKLREIKEKTGTGIIHFNNPLQLINRLELLIGSLLAGNNGVIQEFSQIAHLLHQMKVITKKNS